MKLTNSMEQVVREHLNQLRTQSSTGDETCWCPLCRADMMALALTALPPRYATRQSGAFEPGPELATRVKQAVGAAKKRVRLFPKHTKDDMVAADAPVWVVNFPLEVSFRTVEEILRRHDGACDCWNCRCDMVAFALNRYPARYGVEHEGKTHLFEHDRDQMRDELAGFLDLAARLVTTIPRHEPETVTA